MGVIAATVVVAGTVTGELLVTQQPLSFWGGVDPTSGEVIDRRHDLSGHRLSGRVLVLPHGRGSCSASGVLLEAIYNRTGPLAIITARTDPIIGLGAILAEELYGIVVPVLTVAGNWTRSAMSGQRVSIDSAGHIVELPA